MLNELTECNASVCSVSQIVNAKSAKFVTPVRKSSTAGLVANDETKSHVLLSHLHLIHLTKKVRTLRHGGVFPNQYQLIKNRRPWVRRRAL